MQPTLSPKRWRNEPGRGNAIDRLAAAFASRGLCFDRRQFGSDLFRIWVFQPDDIISRFVQHYDDFVQFRMDGGRVAIPLDQHHTRDDDSGNRKCIAFVRRNGSNSVHSTIAMTKT